MYTKDVFGDFDCRLNIYWSVMLLKMFAGPFFLKRDRDAMNLINWFVFHLHMWFLM